MKTLIDLAIEVAIIAHQKQVRKGTDIPYITHPLAVGIILAQTGCSEEVITAGILHDTVEDTNITLDDLRDQFGEKVSTFVKGASEPDRALPWEDRKRHTTDHNRNQTIANHISRTVQVLHELKTQNSHDDQSQVSE